MRHGSKIDPPNRFEAAHRERDLEHVEWDTEYLRGLGNRRIEYFDDASRSLISENTSPDIPFRYSINPYRGCVHGCSYCYARNSHEYLGFNAGLDFETKIVVKKQAPDLLRDLLSRDRYVVEPLMFSGVTDCYQPAEREFRLTRQCLEIALECRQPVSIITKNALVTRDLDLLGPMAERNLVSVYLSINSLDAEFARAMEPRTSVPAARMRAVKLLAEAGVPVGVMLAPIIPGLNDTEIPALLEAAAQHGARSAGWILLRLPLTVRPVFQEWLERTQPLKAAKVEQLIRDTRDGKLNSSEFGKRMRGKGRIAKQIGDMFKLFSRKHGLDRRLPATDCSQFDPPRAPGGQMRLF